MQKTTKTNLIETLHNILQTAAEQVQLLGINRYPEHSSTAGDQPVPFLKVANAFLRMFLRGTEIRLVPGTSLKLAA